MEEITKVENKDTPMDQTGPKVDDMPKSDGNPLVDKILKEKKNAMTALQEYKQKVSDLEKILQDKEEQALREKEDYKSLADTYKKKADELENNLTSMKMETVNNVKRAEIRKELRKMGAREERIDFLLKNVDLGSLKYDDEHKVVLGVEEQAAKLKAEAEEFFGKASAGVGHNTPDYNIDSIKSVDDFMKLPKEKRTKEAEMELWKAKGIPVRK